MANGLPEKPLSPSSDGGGGGGGDAAVEEYVLRSGVRSGLKREFAFALRAQAEMMAATTPMGRTRSGKIHRPSAPSQDRTARRTPVKSDAGTASLPVDASLLLLLPPSPVAPIEASPVAEIASTPEVSPVLSQIRTESLAEIPVGSDGQVEKSDASAMPGEAPLSVPPVQGENMPNGLLEASPIPNQVETDCVAETSMDVDGQSKKSDASGDQGGNMPASILEASPAPNQAEMDSVVETHMDVHESKKSDPSDERGENMPASVLEASPAPKQEEIDPIVETPMDIGSLSKKSDASDVSSCGPFPPEETPSVLPLMGSNEVAPVVEPAIPRDMKDEPVLAIAVDVSSAPVLVESQAVVESVIKIEDQGRQIVEKNGVSERPMPIRRFTRSLLKASTEGSPALAVEASSSTSSGSNGLEVTKVHESDMGNESGEQPRTTLKKKMELKMSKKIALTKFPSNVRELLGTGLLDGLPVHYVTRTYNKQGGLRGLIKNGSIVCFCTSCEGSKAISAYQFELHAGSTKKHPSDFICLENGNSMRDIIRACASAPLDMLESTIQNAISSVGVKDCSTCHRCKESSEKSHIGKLTSICDSCLVAKLSPICSSSSQKNASSAGLAKPPSVPSSSDCTSMSTSTQKKPSHGRMTRKDLRLHKLVFMDDILPDGTEVAYYARGQKLLEGYIKGSGIFCQCCNSVVSPSQFEAHAGWASRRKPYLNIYTSNGVSLHELSVSLSKGRKFSVSESDDLCRICADGGDLLLCDICPRAFHKECVGLTTVPTGDWYCPCCQNMHQKEKFVEHNENAFAAGRETGVDPIEQIVKRCIRIVNTPEADASSCVLCRCHDFSKTGFGPRTVLLCDQCEKEFHVGCLKDHNMADLKELPLGKWFCSTDCDRIHAALQNLLLSGPQQLPVLQTNMIKRKYEDKGLNSDDDLDVRWRLLSGKTASPDSRLFLSKALSIFHECFDPIIDLATGKDLIPSMLYGRDMRDQEFGGMYCAVLILNSSVVSAGTVRVLGCEVAEIPLVATSRECQGQGYFQSLFSCIERTLDSLGVKHMVLPAADEAESIWTKKFGFSKITMDQLEELTKGSRTMTFQGTSLLHKLVPKSCSIE